MKFSEGSSSRWRYSLERPVRAAAWIVSWQHAYFVTAHGDVGSTAGYIPSARCFASAPSSTRYAKRTIHSSLPSKDGQMTFKQRLYSNKPLLGTMITLSSSEIAEVLSMCGFDWLFIDGEHGPLESADIRTLLTAAGSTPCLVRVPSLDVVPIKKALDLGAAGVIVPQVNTPADAACVVDWCRYPPVGSRGIGLGRAHGYGKRFREYIELANEELLVVIQVEHRDAVESIEKIVNVPGIDCIFLGPYDLSGSYGKTGQTDDPEVVAALARVENVCKKSEMPLGIFGLSPEAVRPYVDRRFNLICAGVDTVMLRNAADTNLRALRFS